MRAFSEPHPARTAASGSQALTVHSRRVPRRLNPAGPAVPGGRNHHGWCCRSRNRPSVDTKAEVEGLTSPHSYGRWSSSLRGRVQCRRK